MHYNYTDPSPKSIHQATYSTKSSNSLFKPKNPHNYPEFHTQSTNYVKFQGLDYPSKTDLFYEREQSNSSYTSIPSKEPTTGRGLAGDPVTLSYNSPSYMYQNQNLSSNSFYRHDSSF